tara:strand:+ start:11841 stop:12887 length:1047 start_codon:yes stop_codon:yes gene_type:complete
LLLAEAEDSSKLKEVFRRLAESEKSHIDLWESKLREAGEEVPDLRASLRVRVLGWLARHFGTDLVVPIVEHTELNAVAMYDDQPEAIAEGLPSAERSHARLFRELSKQPGEPIDVARLEGRHSRYTGNALRAAVLGANDGLVSNLSLVMGFAGAATGQEVVALAGVAGLLAGAISMALGEWISVLSGREAFNRQVEIERDELEMNPEEEHAELVLIYQAKGLSEEVARSTADRVFENHETALNTLVHEELGMSEASVAKPSTAAISSFLLFAVGALLPAFPWFFVDGLLAIALSLGLGAAGLFVLGSAVTLWTGRSALYSGVRQLALGLVAAGATYGIGTALGIAIDI